MVKKEECAWITKDGFCRWHKEPCCRTTPGACAECVRRVHPCKDAYCWLKETYNKRSAKGRMQFFTRGVSGRIVYSECTGKVRYPTDSRAWEVARIRMDKGSSQLRVYHCRFCGGFHLTHRVRHEAEVAIEAA